MKSNFLRLLDEIGVKNSETIFVHSSMNWIGGGVAHAVCLIKALIETVGPSGTIIMPSYTWRGVPGQPPRGSILDLRRTPCMVGLLPEIFRRWPGVSRSASYWVPVCALGALAHELTAGQEDIINPFAPGSTFRRLSEISARLVGLGVSLNTSSLSHLPDYDLAAECPIPIFSMDPIEGEIIDSEGRHHHTRTIIVRQELMAGYKPSALFEHSPSLCAKLVRIKRGEANFFSYPIDLFHSEGIMVGRKFLSSGRLPPWLPELNFNPIDRILNSLK